MSQDTKDAAPAATQHTLTEEDLAYARKVVHRRHLEVLGKTLNADEIEAKLAELTAQAIAELVACGREGLIEECHKLLGI